MPKGKTCPACGNLQFHDKVAYSWCSSCHSIGWWETPGRPGEGKGKKCHHCGTNTLHEILADKGITVNHCSKCKATMIKGLDPDR